MAVIELEQVTLPYEFEDRARLFIETAQNLLRQFPLHSEVENLTIESVKELQERILEVKNKGNDALLQRVIGLEHDYQIESAEKNAVVISLYSHTKKPIYDAENKINALAKSYRGVRTNNDEEIVDFGDDPSEENYRFLINFIYDFRNDIK